MAGPSDERRYRNCTPENGHLKGAIHLPLDAEEAQFMTGKQIQALRCARLSLPSVGGKPTS